LKRPPKEWEKTFASCISHKGVITRIHRELKKLNSPKTNDLIKKQATELNRNFSKDEVQMAKTACEKLSPSLAIKKCKSKPQ
jgi:hypothetical protein